MILSPVDSPTGQARSFLTAHLANGPRPVAAVIAAGARYGHDAPTIRAAGAELGVRTVPGPLTTGYDGRLVATARWAIPPSKTTLRRRPASARESAAARGGRRHRCGCVECPTHAPGIDN